MHNTTEVPHAVLLHDVLRPLTWRCLACPGVATAFAAPIGGLLFTIEEGASFYSTSIFWRGFLSTGIGVFTLHFLVECAVRGPPLISQHPRDSTLGVSCTAVHCPATEQSSTPPLVSRYVMSIVLDWVTPA